MEHAIYQILPVEKSRGRHADCDNLQKLRKLAEVCKCRGNMQKLPNVGKIAKNSENLLKPEGIAKFGNTARIYKNQNPCN